jgi:hypothetical protein
MSKEIVESKVVCPKCKSKDLFLIEIWKDSGITWEQIGGKFDRNDGVLEHGGPYRVEARCKKCDYYWKIKKVTDIHEVIK